MERAHEPVDARGEVAVLPGRVLAQHVREHRDDVAEPAVILVGLDDRHRIHEVEPVSRVALAGEAGLGSAGVERSRLEVHRGVVERVVRGVADAPVRQVEQAFDLQARPGIDELPLLQQEHEAQ